MEEEQNYIIPRYEENFEVNYFYFSFSYLDFIGEENKQALSTISEETIVNQLLNTDDEDEIKRLVDLFNTTQVKKNALRVVKLNNLLDKVETQAINRFEYYGDEISNKDLINYMQVISNHIDKAVQNVNSINEKPLIQINQANTNTTINIANETTTLTRENKENVKSALEQLLKLVQEDTKEEDNIIDIDTEESIDNEE